MMAPDSTLRQCSAGRVLRTWAIGWVRWAAPCRSAPCRAVERASLEWCPSVLLLSQEQKDGLDAPVHVLFPRDAELREDRVNVLLDGPFGDDQGLRNGGVAHSLG